MIRTVGLCNILVQKPEGKRLFERSRRKWKDIYICIKVDIKEIGCGD
jgi:hypothetical protein